MAATRIVSLCYLNSRQLHPSSSEWSFHGNALVHVEEMFFYFKELVQKVFEQMDIAFNVMSKNFVERNLPTRTSINPSNN